MLRVSCGEIGNVVLCTVRFRLARPYQGLLLAELIACQLLGISLELQHCSAVAIWARHARQDDRCESSHNATEKKT